MRVPAAPRVGLDASGTPAISAPGGLLTMPQSPAPRQIQEFGQALSTVGGVTTRIGLEVQDNIDESAVRLSDAVLRQRVAETWGDYSQRIGQQAVFDPAAPMRKVEADRRKLEEKLSPTQRQLWKMSADSVIGDLSVKVKSHHAEQARVFEFATHTARAETAIISRNQALEAGDDGERLAQEALVGSEVVAAARLQGVADEAMPGLVRTAFTKMHALHIDRLASEGRGIEAAGYLRSAMDRGQIQPEEVGRLRRVVDRAELDDRSTQLQMRIVGQLERIPIEEATAVVHVNGNPLEVTTWQGEQQRAGKVPPRYRANPVTRPTFLLEARQELDRLYTAKEITAAERDATFSRIKEEHALRRGTEAESTQGMLQQAEQWLTANPTAGVQSLAKANPQLFDGLEQRGLLPDLNTFAESGRRYSTDPDAFVAARSIDEDTLRKLTPQQLFVAFRPKLSNRDFESLMARHAQAMGSANESQLSLLKIDERVEIAARKMGLTVPSDRKRPSEEIRKRFSEFRGELDNRLLRKQAELGRRITDQELQNELDEMIVDKIRIDPYPMQGLVFGKRGFLDVVVGSEVEISAAALSSERIGEAFVYVGGEQVYLRDIPEEHRARIPNFLRSKGQAPTMQLVAELWMEAGAPGGPERFRRRQAEDRGQIVRGYRGSTTWGEVPAQDRSRIAEELVKSGEAPTIANILQAFDNERTLQMRKLEAGPITTEEAEEIVETIRAPR